MELVRSGGDLDAASRYFALVMQAYQMRLSARPPCYATRANHAAYVNELKEAQ